MTCAHCCYSCTEDGIDMPFGTFKKIIDAHQPDSIAIGGGEPTLHPDFVNMLFYAISKCGGNGEVWLATNGSQKDTSITLANLARKGVIGCALSLDDYHDPISEEVIWAFKDGLAPKGSHIRHEDYRSIRTVNRISPVGRALVNGLESYAEEEFNCCGGNFVTPDGKIFYCDCIDSPQIGFIDDIWEKDYGSECYKERDIE